MVERGGIQQNRAILYKSLYHRRVF